VVGDYAVGDRDDRPLHDDARELRHRSDGAHGRAVLLHHAMLGDDGDRRCLDGLGHMGKRQPQGSPRLR
jgi:hypothetical protein